MVYYLGPYFEDGFTTNYLNGESVTPVPDGYYFGIDFVDSPTDLSSLIFTLRNSSGSSTTGFGTNYGTGAIVSDESDDWSHVLIIPAGFSNFFDSSFNMNSDTTVEVLNGNTAYSYKFNATYNGRMKSVEGHLFFPNFAHPTDIYSGQLNMISVNTTFADSSAGSPVSSYIYPNDNSDLYYDNSVDIYFNDTTTYGVSKTGTTLDTEVVVGEFPVVYDFDSSNYMSIQSIDAYGNVLSTNQLSSTGAYIPEEWTITDVAVSASRFKVVGEVNLETFNSLRYEPTYAISEDFTYTSAELDIQVWSEDGTQLWSLQGTHGTGAFWKPDDYTASGGEYSTSNIPIVVIDYDSYTCAPGTNWIWKLVTPSGTVVAEAETTVSYDNYTYNQSIVFTEI